MTKVGLHKIVGVMFRGPMTLAELAEVSTLSKSTVHYHMQNLIEQGVVFYDKKNGKYSIQINDELKKIILNCLRKKRTISEISQELEKEAKKDNHEKSSLKLFVKDKDVHTKLNDLLEFLYEEGLVMELKDYQLVGSRFTATYYWTLTWVGCQLLGICHVCKEKLIDGATISQTIERVSINEQFDVYSSSLVHPKCIKNALSSYSNYFSDQYTDEGDVCNYCGLPLSESRIREWIDRTQFGKNGFQLIYDFLTQSEIDSLNEFRKNELKKQFKKRYKVDAPEKTFEGNILLNKKFNFYINLKLGEKILNPDEFKKWDFILFGDKPEIFKPQNASFDHLSEPRFSDIENLLKITYKEKNTIPEGRIKELFNQWIMSDRIQREQVEQLVSSLFSSPMSKIYPKIWNYLPEPHDIPYERDEIVFGEPVYQKSLGYSFVFKDKDGNCYHELCFNKQNQLQLSKEKKVN